MRILVVDDESNHHTSSARAAANRRILPGRVALGYERVAWRDS